jgi:hypothetical protein
MGKVALWTRRSELAPGDDDAVAQLVGEGGHEVWVEWWPVPKLVAEDPTAYG